MNNTFSFVFIRKSYQHVIIPSSFYNFSQITFYRVLFSNVREYCRSYFVNNVKTNLIEIFGDFQDFLKAPLLNF